MEANRGYFIYAFPFEKHEIWVNSGLVCALDLKCNVPLLPLYESTFYVLSILKYSRAKSDLTSIQIELQTSRCVQANKLANYQTSCTLAGVHTGSLIQEQATHFFAIFQ